jgi:hypothetical protein
MLRRIIKRCQGDGEALRENYDGLLSGSIFGCILRRMDMTRA